MNNCQVFHPARPHHEDPVPPLDFTGNQPALPPLTTESVVSVVYLIDDEPAP
ncbi:hypothetical protein [Geomesophilobacter sediminis]|uniref:Uncharacterized protein n=1 Tax=Geomesophilobacter sediminis TaxID=2798584 RepID=A0A8J7IPZ6_9BACT|nr:hypothetical protein [Geomesophilobacter sediminis]MBJ6724579.1 hypothetical protein [Geomesophilobacter sediminis]